MSDTIHQPRFIPGENAPMSPHLQVWKFTVTMAASISQRITGAANAAGMLVLTLWIGSAALSEGAYDVVSNFLSSWFGLVIIASFTLSVMFHMLNGVRYLFADGGRGLEKSTSRKTAWAAYAGAIALTGAIMFAGFAIQGGIN